MFDYTYCCSELKYYYYIQTFQGKVKLKGIFDFFVISKSHVLQVYVLRKTDVTLIKRFSYFIILYHNRFCLCFGIWGFIVFRIKISHILFHEEINQRSFFVFHISSLYERIITLTSSLSISTPTGIFEYFL